MSNGSQKHYYNLINIDVYSLSMGSIVMMNLLNKIEVPQNYEKLLYKTSFYCLTGSD